MTSHEDKVCFPQLPCFEQKLRNVQSENCWIREYFGNVERNDIDWTKCYTILEAQITHWQLQRKTWLAGV